MGSRDDDEGTEPARPAPYHGRPATQAIRDALPTRRRARALLDMTAAALDSRAFVETTGGGKAKALYLGEVADPRFLVPTPLLEIGGIGRFQIDLGGGEAPDPRLESLPTPGPFAPLRALPEERPATSLIRLADGSGSMTVEYADDGLWRCTSEDREPLAFAGALAALAGKGSFPVEILTDFFATLDLARFGPGRVFLPVPAPGGVRGTWMAGLRALRLALHGGRIPDRARFAVADGRTGSAVAFGVTREEAWAAWRVEVERVRPVLAKPDPEEIARFEAAAAELLNPPDSWTPEGDREIPLFAGVFRGVPIDGAVDSPDPATCPAVLVALDPVPLAPHSFGSWTRWLDDRGATVFAAMRPDALGYTLVGASLLDRIDLGALEASLDAYDARVGGIFSHDELPSLQDRPKTRNSVSVYQILDEPTNAVGPPRNAARSFPAAVDATSIQSGSFRTHVVRVRRRA